MTESQPTAQVLGATGKTGSGVVRDGDSPADRNDRFGQQGTPERRCRAVTGNPARAFQDFARADAAAWGEALK
jgi:hypothetical protein